MKRDRSRRGNAMKITAGSKLIMMGDSVTDCGRAQPVGEGLFGATGNGYVALVDALLSSTYPERGIRVINMGTGGNTVRELKDRWQRDIIEQQPDWLSVMIGINDVWRQHDLPRQPETHVYLEEYRRTLDELIATTKPLVKGLVLMTPYFIESSTQDAMRAQMDQYGAAVRDIAKRHKTFFVDTQAAFNQFLTHYHSAALTWDRVHPNTNGHMILARAFLQAVDFTW
jgi:lysophospholipase L1-like esterase